MITYGCIAPHGAELIPSLATRQSLASFQKTRDGMRRLASGIAATRPDTVIIASPHNLRLFRRIGVVTAENSSGTLATSPTKSVRLRAKCDVAFAKNLLSLADGRGLPVVGANYGTSEGEASNMPMDWGTLIPLWFALRETNPKSKIVIVTPSREIPLRENVLFGRAIADLAKKTRRRHVFIASADQAHAHLKKGPYEFSKDASRYDRMVAEAIRMNSLKRILQFDRRMVERAKPDSLWQMAMLVGLLERVNMGSELFSYDVPTYYGMICAGFAPRQN
jgi:aromatic ring-opening dioxygenase LigB subunit